LTVITVDQSHQPVFVTYKDNYGSINLFAEDQHSIAYASLTDSVGGTLSGDIVSGELGNNAAGIWNLTCDQGEYELKLTQYSELVLYLAQGSHYVGGYIRSCRGWACR